MKPEKRATSPAIANEEVGRWLATAELETDGKGCPTRFIAWNDERDEYQADSHLDASRHVSECPDERTALMVRFDVVLAFGVAAHEAGVSAGHVTCGAALEEADARLRAAEARAAKLRQTVLRVIRHPSKIPCEPYEIALDGLDEDDAAVGS